MRILFIIAFTVAAAFTTPGPVQEASGGMTLKVGGPGQDDNFACPWNKCWDGTCRRDC